MMRHNDPTPKPAQDRPRARAAVALALPLLLVASGSAAASVMGTGPYIDLLGGKVGVGQLVLKDASCTGTYVQTDVTEHREGHKIGIGFKSLYVGVEIGGSTTTHTYYDFNVACDASFEVTVRGWSGIDRRVGLEMTILREHSGASSDALQVASGAAAGGLVWSGQPLPIPGELLNADNEYNDPSTCAYDGVLVGECSITYSQVVADIVTDSQTGWKGALPPSVQVCPGGGLVRGYNEPVHDPAGIHTRAEVAAPVDPSNCVTKEIIWTASQANVQLGMDLGELVWNSEG